MKHVTIWFYYIFQGIKALLLTFGTLLLLMSVSFAADGISVGTVAGNITDSMENIAKLVTAGAYVGGFGFAVGAILKFKAHKDNPTQIPVGTPIALIFIAAALIFLPAIFGVAGKTIFGDTTAKTGGITGVIDF